MSGSILDTFDQTYTRHPNPSGAPFYTQQQDKTAASILWHFRADQNHHPEYHHQTQTQQQTTAGPGLKMENPPLMMNHSMGDNIRRDGFAVHNPASGHAHMASSAETYESLRLPPIQLPLRTSTTLPTVLPHPLHAFSHPQLMHNHVHFEQQQQQQHHSAHHFHESQQQLIPQQYHEIQQQSISQQYHETQQHPAAHQYTQTMAIDGDETEEDLASPEVPPASNNIHTTNTTTAPPPANSNNSNSNSNSNNSNNPIRTLCRFDGEVCHINGDTKHGENPRKVVSHIFGRNKVCTVFIPDECWVWWCRKHYQRRRYHTNNWALEQIKILFENLDKIEAWGGVECFTIALRKRESDRGVGSSAANGDKASTSRRRAAGRGVPSSTDKENGGKKKPDSIKVGASGRPIRSPVNVASPVPQFLLNHVNQKKSFDEVRLLLHEIKKYVEAEANRMKEVTFPDIEILPKYNKTALREMGFLESQLSEDNHSRRRRARKPITSTAGRSHPYATNARF